MYWHNRNMFRLNSGHHEGVLFPDAQCCSLYACTNTSTVLHSCLTCLGMPGCADGSHLHSKVSLSSILPRWFNPISDFQYFSFLIYFMDYRVWQKRQNCSWRSCEEEVKRRWRHPSQPSKTLENFRLALIVRCETEQLLRIVSMVGNMFFFILLLEFYA